MAVIFFVAIVVVGAGASPRSRREQQRSDVKDRFDREEYVKNDPEEERATHLEK